MKVENCFWVTKSKLKCRNSALLSTCHVQQKCTQLFLKPFLMENWWMVFIWSTRCIFNLKRSLFCLNFCDFWSILISRSVTKEPNIEWRYLALTNTKNWIPTQLTNWDLLPTTFEKICNIGTLTAINCTNYRLRLFSNVFMEWKLIPAEQVSKNTDCNISKGLLHSELNKAQNLTSHRNGPDAVPLDKEALYILPFRLKRSAHWVKESIFIVGAR